MAEQLQTLENPLSQSLHEVLIQPLLNRDHVYYENVSQALGDLGGDRLNEETRHLLGLLATRSVTTSAIAGGYSTYNFSALPDVESHLDYMEAFGLVDRKEFLTGSIVVQDVTNVTEVASSATDLGRTIVPYIQCGELYEVAQDVGTSVYGSGHEVAKDVVDKFYGKTGYRDLMKQLHGEGVFGYPRLVVDKNEVVESSYLNEFLDFSEDGIFVQYSSAGGGMGNLPFVRVDDYYKDLKSGEEYSPEELKDHLSKLAKIGGLDITPLLKTAKDHPVVSETYTLCVSITDSNVSVFGPVDQIVHPETKDYQGFVFDIDVNNNKYIDLQTQIERAKAFGNHLRESGYRGWGDEDLFQYYGADGNIYVGRSESNLRLDAYTHLLRIVASDSNLLERFSHGKLSLMQNDHMTIPSSLFIAIDGQSKNLAEYLGQNGVPMFSSDSRKGAILMTKPFKGEHDESGNVAIAIISETDEEKYQVYEQIKNLLS